MKAGLLHATVLLALVFSLGAAIGPAATATAAPGTICVDASDPGAVSGHQSDPYSVVYRSIQDAVNDVTVGDTVSVGAGTYNEFVTVNKSLTLQGAQAGVDARGRAGAETIVVAPASKAVYVSTNASNSVTIDGFSIRGKRGTVDLQSGTARFVNNIVYSLGNEAGKPPALVNVGGNADSVVSNVVVQYNDISPSPASELPSGCNALRINVVGAASVLVDNNHLHNGSNYPSALGAGLGVGASDSAATITVSNNEMDHNGSDGMFTYNATFGTLTVTGNVIHDNAQRGVKIWTGVNGTVAINDNHIYNNGLEGVVNQNSFTIDATNNWWGDNSGPYHPTTNPGGTGDAVSDNVVYNAWTGQGGVQDCWVDDDWAGLSVGTAVPLPGNGTCTIGLDAFASIQSAVGASASGGTVTVGPGSYLENVPIGKALTLQGANAGVSAGANPGSRGAESIVDGCIALQASGIVVDGFQVNNGSAFLGEKAGIYVLAATGGHTIENNVLVGTDTSVVARGILFGYNTNGIVVKDNEIANWLTGFYINPSSDHGLLCDGNNLQANFVGIGSDGLNDVTIQNNDFTGNTFEGIGTSTVGTGVEVHSNDFSGNAAGINNYGGPGILDATNNWWGDASGPHNAATNPDGTGDAVSDGVEYEPWIQRLCTLTVSSTAGGRMVNPDEGTSTVLPGATVQLQAVSDPEYDFVEWTGDVLGVNDRDSAETFVTVNGDCSIAANFLELGDADGNGRVDVFDWVKVKRIVLGLDSRPPRGKPDADKDGDVDIFDWVKVKRTILGL